MSIGIYEANFDGEGLRIGIVQARCPRDTAGIAKDG